MHASEQRAISYTHAATPEHTHRDQRIINEYCHTHNIDLTEQYHDTGTTRTGIRALHAAITSTLDPGAQSADYLFTTHWPPAHLDQPTLDALEADLNAADTHLITLTTPTSDHTAEEATND